MKLPRYICFRNEAGARLTCAEDCRQFFGGDAYVPTERMWKNVSDSISKNMGKQMKI